MPFEDHDLPGLWAEGSTGKSDCSPAGGGGPTGGVARPVAEVPRPGCAIPGGSPSDCAILCPGMTDCGVASRGVAGNGADFTGGAGGAV